ncbi:hypothetical protein RF11_01921 [Thelohanellus kitauei]|uniref:Uncharacterized protein n=1 Tax=Thelohanellus kitauei TaxID=669202 RepID=A0A0C2MQT7_THEKT|nr:hypothetical protein RF11_01921 [Thelohanellus kitauei]
MLGQRSSEVYKLAPVHFCTNFASTVNATLFTCYTATHLLGTHRQEVRVVEDSQLLNIKPLCCVLMSNEITVDFPNINPTHRIEFSGAVTARCNDSRNVEMVTGNTFKSEWTDQFTIMTFYFDIDIEETYYIITDIGVDVKIRDSKYALIDINRKVEIKHHNKFRISKTYYLSKRQTNCTFYNILISLPEINDPECVFQLNFTTLRLEFLKAETLECIEELVPPNRHQPQNVWLFNN